MITSPYVTIGVALQLAPLLVAEANPVVDGIVLLVGQAAKFVGQLIAGGVLQPAQLTVTMKLAVDVLPHASVAV